MPRGRTPAALRPHSGRPPAVHRPVSFPLLFHSDLRRYMGITTAGPFVLVFAWLVRFHSAGGEQRILKSPRDYLGFSAGFLATGRTGPRSFGLIRRGIRRIFKFFFERCQNAGDSLFIYLYSLFIHKFDIFFCVTSLPVEKSFLPNFSVVSCGKSKKLILSRINRNKCLR